MTYPSSCEIIGSNLMLLRREYYVVDLEELIKSKFLSRSDICSMMCSICDICDILCGYNLVVSNLKSSNIIYDGNNNVKMCDLFLNLLRKDDENRVYDINYESPEELSGLECNDKSMIWSIGCILYEMICKKLPFNEDNNIMKTMNNILRCKYSLDINCDDEMKEMIERMLKVKSEDRLCLKELKKEMTKMSEVLRDHDNNMMICEERKEILYNGDYSIEITPFDIQRDYYVKYNKNEEIRDSMIVSYNSKANERMLSILLMIKFYNRDKIIQDRLKFQIKHQCKNRKEYYLDEMIFNINSYNDEKVDIHSKCVCLCEEGINYLFRMLKLMNPKALQFDINIPNQFQICFLSYFIELSNLQELYLYGGKHMHIPYYGVGPTTLKLLLPYLRFFIYNKDNELDLHNMNLSDESMMLLSEELYKYPKLNEIDIRRNKNIHSKGLKALFSKFPISKVRFYFNGSKELLIDKNIPKLIKYIKDYRNNRLSLKNCEIDDDIFQSFILLRLNELKEINELDLSNNKLTNKSIEILINHLSSFPSLEKLQIYENKIGDEGMRILSPHLQLLKNDYNVMNCSKMGLSSDGLKYLLDGLVNIDEKIRLLNISDNRIDSLGIESLMNYEKEKNKIQRLIIDNNPIGNDGFMLLENNLIMLKYGNEINLSNISINDKSVTLLTNKLDSIEYYKIINLNENNIRMNGLKSICPKSLGDAKYPFIEMKNESWNNEELEYYLDYSVKKPRESWYGEHDFSNMNINDSHISLIKQIHRGNLDLSNNHISYKGLKEITDCLSKEVWCISIFNNPIGDEGIEIICRYIDKFVYYSSTINISNTGMSEKGLKMLIKRLKDYKPLKIINLSENELNERELRLMKENKEVFNDLHELSISVKENIDKTKLKSFLKTFSSLGIIKLDGISEEEKKELSQEYCNVKTQ